MNRRLCLSTAAATGFAALGMVGIIVGPAAGADDWDMAPPTPTSTSTSTSSSVPTAGAAPSAIAADATIDDLQKTGQLEQPFFGYLYRNSFGYLNAQKALNDGALACALESVGGSSGELVDTMRTSGNTLNEAQAIVRAMQQARDSQPLC